MLADRNAHDRSQALRIDDQDLATGPIRNVQQRSVVTEHQIVRPAFQRHLLRFAVFDAVG